jgi:DNA-binding transcriptional ArsR family regulator
MLYLPSTPSADPALLAFVKCHLSSVARWDVLRTLEPLKGSWVSPESLARQLHKPVSTIRDALDELLDEEIVEMEREADGARCYRLNPDDPTTRVIERLIAASTRDQTLRQLLVARIVQGSHHM